MCLVSVRVRCGKQKTCAAFTQYGTVCRCADSCRVRGGCLFFCAAITARCSKCHSHNKHCTKDEWRVFFPAFHLHNIVSFKNCLFPPVNRRPQFWLISQEDGGCLDIPAWHTTDQPSRNRFPMAFSKLWHFGQDSGKRCLTATGSRRICTCFPGQSSFYHNRLRTFRQDSLDTVTVL